MGNRVSVVCRLVLILLGVLVLRIAPTQAQLTSTTTKLTLSSAGNAVSTVTAGTKLTLTATVSAGSTPATVGLVTFCDAAATDCTAFHRLGTAQLTSSGSAAINVVPSPGSHSYKAVFAGTPNGTAKLASSTSGASTLTVNASLPTTTTMAVTGNAGNYTLTATVSGNGSAALSGSTSFVDTSNNNQVLGTKPLTGNATVLQVINSSNPPQGDTPWSATVGDFNRDGIPDVAVGDSSDQNLSIYLGNGDGTFAPVILVALPPLSSLYVLSMSATDFNQDGIPDLVICNGAGVLVLLGKGDGTFTATTSSPILVDQPSTALSGAATVGDFNCDGIPDIAVATNAAAGGYFTVMTGKGDGTFAVNTTPFAPDRSIAILAEDFNGDGKVDVAVVDFLGEVGILLSNGDGTFTEAANSPLQVKGNPWGIAEGDFNSDGITDLVVSNSAYTGGGGGSVSILLGNGDGSFRQAAGSPVTTGPRRKEL